MITSKDELRSVGLRATTHRISVLEILKNSAIPLTLTSIESSLSENQMDLSTLYRVLDQFEKSGLIMKTVPLEPSQSVYSYRKGGHQHHLICLECGKITVIEGCPLHEYELKIAEEFNYKIVRHQLELYGVCPECQLRIAGQ